MWLQVLGIAIHLLAGAIGWFVATRTRKAWLALIVGVVLSYGLVVGLASGVGYFAAPELPAAGGNPSGTAVVRSGGPESLVVVSMFSGMFMALFIGVGAAVSVNGRRVVRDGHPG